MAVPKKKVSTSRRGKRRSHHALNKIVIIECENCGAETLPLHIWMNCGHYNKRLVLEIKKIEEKKE